MTRGTAQGSASMGGETLIALLKQEQTPKGTNPRRQSEGKADDFGTSEGKGK